MCGCVTVLTDAGRVSPGVLLEIGRCVRADKLRRRERERESAAGASSSASPGRVSALPLLAIGWEDLSGPAVMMRAF